MPSELEIVVAHYNEDLSWLLPWEPYVTVYHKGNRSCNYLPHRFKQWIYLDNVGREGHTYLHHMTTRYNSLAEITIFLQARVDDHPHLTINEYIFRAKQTGFSHVPCIRQKGWEDQIAHDVKWLREYHKGQLEPACHTFGEFWDYLFGRPLKATNDNSRCQCLRQHIPFEYTKPRPLRWYRPKVQNTVRPGFEKSNFVLMKYPCCRPQVLELFWAGCFGVSRETIHQNPVSFYSKIIPYLKHHSNPEEGHYLERLWFTIFRKKESLLEKDPVIKNDQSGIIRSSISDPGLLLTIIKNKTLKLQHQYRDQGLTSSNDRMRLLTQIEVKITKLEMIT